MEDRKRGMDQVKIVEQILNGGENLDKAVWCRSTVHIEAKLLRDCLEIAYLRGLADGVNKSTNTLKSVKTSILGD